MRSSSSKSRFKNFRFFFSLAQRGGAMRSGTRRDEAGRAGTLPLRGSVWKLGILKVSVKQQRSVLRAASENLIKLSFPPHAFEIVCARALRAASCC